MWLSLTAATAWAVMSGAAWAQVVSYSVSTGNGVKTASVQPVDLNGVVYVPLGALVSQVGGGFKMTPDRAQIDLAEKSAWLRSNNTQVSASLGIFVLGAPVVQSGSDVLIAATDVAVFFEKAFRLAARQQSMAAPVTPAPPAPPAAVEPPVQGAEPEPDGLEPLSPAGEPAVVPLEPLVKQEAVEQLPPPSDQPTAPEMTPAAPDLAAPPTADDAEPGAEGLMAKAAPNAELEAPAAADRPVDRPVSVVIIDPGHGGADIGCQGSGRVAESGVVLAVAGKLQKALETGSPLKCVLTREEDRAMSRTERVFTANARKGDLFVSLHTGASWSGGQRGCRLFVAGSSGSDAAARYAERSRRLAEAISAGITEATGEPSAGIYQLGCHVVQETAMPALMIELGMLTNPEEERLLASEDYQAKLAAGIAAGIKKYMESK